MELADLDIHVCEVLCLQIAEIPEFGCFQDMELNTTASTAALRQYLEQARTQSQSRTPTMDHAIKRLTDYLFMKQDEVSLRFQTLVHQSKGNKGWTCSSKGLHKAALNFGVKRSEIFAEFGRCASATQAEVLKLSKASQQKRVSFQYVLDIARKKKSSQSRESYANMSKRWTTADIKSVHDEVKAR